jgi:hypothetical protein
MPPTNTVAEAWRSYLRLQAWVSTLRAVPYS